MRQFVSMLMLLLLITSGAVAQTVLKGVIKDQNGAPVANATIKSGNKTVTSGNDGSFSIEAVKNAKLTIKAPGMEEISVPASDGITISLQKASKVFEDVVITGYTTQIKRKNVGSASVVKGDEVRNVPIGSFDQALQGKAPGILVQAQSGQPGAAARINIRGTGSVLGSTDPLYVVDGIQITANDFASLNPNDFESFSILKDASSTAIYGSRGANGVVLITTRKGKFGKPVLAYDYQYGVSQLPVNKLEVMNTNEKLDYEIANGDPYDWQADPAFLTELRGINTKWSDVFFQKGKTNTHQLSLNGGNDNTRYFISGNIFNQTGTVRTTDLKRYSGRANLETNFSNFKVGLNTYFGWSRINNTLENSAFIGAPLNAVLWLNPYQKPYDENGNYSGIFSGQPHPLQELLETVNKNDQLKAISTLNIEYNVPFVKGLKLRTNWGIDFTEDELFNYLDKQTYQGSIATGQNGSLERSIGKLFRYTGTNAISYNKAIDKHEFTIGLFNEIVQETRRGFNLEGYGLLTPFRNETGITPGTSSNGFIPTVGGFESKRGLASIFTNLDYGYNNKYFVTANIRRDGSSRFGENKRYAVFGSIGAAWLVSDENFLASTRKWLDILKLKASYGTVGNQDLGGSFPSLAQASVGRYAGQGGLVLSTLANNNLQWEQKATLNFGLEFALLKNRIKGSVEYYDSKTTSLFLDKAISGTSGFATFTTNIGELSNSGIEVGLDADVLKINDFTWNINVQFTNNKNKLLSLADGKQEEIVGDFIRKVGSPLNTYYLVKVAGVDPATGDQLYYKKDGKTTTNIYDPADRVEVGTADAPKFGGFGTAFRYKGFSIGTFFSFINGNVIYNNDRNNLANPGYLFDNLSKDLLTEWRTPGQVTNIPRPDNEYFTSTTRFIESGNFIRWRNLNVSYTLPTQWLTKAKLKSAKIFFVGQNLATFTDYRGWDPELNTGTSTGARYPALKTLTGGISVTF
jgi:TonB-dependent starch-binding outer membrane protein SusC